ncbi:MAG: hypothetical protein AAGC60_29855 [Acidobacteriota bacterium]
MIRLERQRTAAAIKVGYRGQNRIRRERELLDRHLAQEKPRSAVWRGAKDQLRSESGGKCAYCEGKAEHVAHGDVEHFRPKSKYWWLAYCYDNFLYSCQICNQSHKSNHFPPHHQPRLPEPALPPTPRPADLDDLAGTLAPDPLDTTAVDQFRSDCRAEGAHLLNPYEEDPEALFAWRADSVLREVELVQRDASSGSAAALEAAETFLGLNRDELKRWRWEVYETAETLALTVLSGRLQPALRRRIEDKLQRMMSTEGEFAGMVRFLVRENLGLAL